MRLDKNIHWIIYSLFVLSCARQTTPTGGPKDSIPPTLINSFPRQGDVNFKGETIELTFSETVILNNPREQLIITPTLGEDVDVTAKKNNVVISFNEPLQQNTTYLLNFRESVQDITEKNPAEMLKLAFSTGPYIDSLSIAGRTFDLLTSKGVEDATVALYQTDTFDIFKHRPTYFTKSDKEGKFNLDNLKPGRYYIYAIQDKNKNLVTDSRAESFGYLVSPITLSADTAAVNIPLIRLDSRPLKLMSARPYGTYFNIKTSKNLTNFKISTAEEERIISSFGQDNTNILIYKTFDKDSVSVKFSAVDSIHNLIDTTLYVKFLQREVTPEKFTHTLNDFKVVESKGVLSGKIVFSKPLFKFNFDSIYYTIDSLTHISIDEQNIDWDSLNNVLTVQKEIDKALLIKKLQTKSTNINKDKPKTTSSAYNQLYLGAGAFISIELDTSTRTAEKLMPMKLEDTGVILVEIQTSADHYIVQLLGKEPTPIASRRNTKTISFEDLKPGDYQIRLIVDKNNDGQWNPGNFYEKNEPEPITYYTNDKGLTLINLKANWELGPLLIRHE